MAYFQFRRYSLACRRVSEIHLCCRQNVCSIAPFQVVVVIIIVLCCLIIPNANQPYYKLRATCSISVIIICMRPPIVICQWPMTKFLDREWIFQKRHENQKNSRLIFIKFLVISFSKSVPRTSPRNTKLDYLLPNCSIIIGGNVGTNE